MSAPARGTRYEVPFGAGTLTFEVPAGLEVEVVAEPRAPEVPAGEAARAALASPAGSPPLAELARGARDAVIVVPDATRPVPTAEILPAFLDAFAAGGLGPDRVTVVVALGLHRGLADAERRALLGPALDRGVRVLEHDARGPMRDLGTGPHGTPMRVNERVAAAGLVTAIGCLEPHAYAGYSGGWKTVGIGCAGEETVGWTHSPRFLDHPRCRLGVVEGNPFREAVAETGRRAGLRFTLNLVPGLGGGVIAAAAGEPEAVFRRLVPAAEQAYATPVSCAADVAVAGVGAPKDANLYQASRAATNLVLGPYEAVREGGTIVIPAPCGEGVGRGAGEIQFAAALRRGAAAVLADRERVFRPGEQRAYVVAKVLASRRIVVVGSSIPDADLRALGIEPARTVEEALAAAAACGARRLLFVPHALRALPVAGDTLVGPAPRPAARP